MDTRISSFRQTGTESNCLGLADLEPLKRTGLSSAPPSLSAALAKWEGPFGVPREPWPLHLLCLGFLIGTMGIISLSPWLEGVLAWLSTLWSVWSQWWVYLSWFFLGLS